MSTSHDPYLNTVKRTLNEERIKKRQKELQDSPLENKGFFSKQIDLADYIYLPESLQNFFITSLFILIPYLFGSFIMFILRVQNIISEPANFTFDSFMLMWIIGYECLAFIVLVLIIKSSFTYTGKQN